MKTKIDVLQTSFILFAIFFIILILAGCEIPEEFGFKTNGILEGTIWVNAYGEYLSFSKNAIISSHTLDYGNYRPDLIAGTTYYSFLYSDGKTVCILGPDEIPLSITLDGYVLKQGKLWYNYHNFFYPVYDTLFINGEYRYYNDFGAIETNSGLAIIGYYGNSRDIVFPNTIGDLPVVSIDGGIYNQSLQLNSITIPNTVNSIGQSVFASYDLMGWSRLPGYFLAGGITIGADVTIHEGNFIGMERQFEGKWEDMGFTQFYNSNGRQAGLYTWTVSIEWTTTPQGVWYNHYVFTWTLK